MHFTLTGAFPCICYILNIYTTFLLNAFSTSFVLHFVQVFIQKSLLIRKLNKFKTLELFPLCLYHQIMTEMLQHLLLGFYESTD